ncbi:hypothetical protein BGZ99_000748 [Dissophora globulifera]|uniref:Peptidase C15, pyroglutamyl peptidase I-like protein n=1 Tax=Dissophora globulifera TaxID=979702 RepID=A0A9P6R1H4_9FUNG|nr:hypothetical protein BGZ99_000748 [Dissophora globulifera]
MAPIDKRADKVKVVLTGFEHLNNTTIDLPSTSGDSTTSRKHDATKADLFCQELPVEYRKVPEIIPAIHTKHTRRSPAAQSDSEPVDNEENYLKTYFIHLGVGRDGHTAIETQAHRTGYGHPDNSNWAPESKDEPPVKKEAWKADPDKLTTTVDTAALAQYLKEKKGWICQQSMDAGLYLCEYTLYLSLAERRRRIESGEEGAEERTCLFVHLPSVGNPYSLEQLQQFVKDMIVAVVTTY